MGAPKGNRFAVGNHGGRPTKLTPEMLEKAKGFLDWKSTQMMERIVFQKGEKCTLEVPEPPTLTSLALYLGISDQTSYNWAEESKEYLEIFTQVKQKYSEYLVRYGLSDQYNAGLAKFLLSSDHGKREGKDITSDGKKIENTLGVITSPAVAQKIKELDEAMKAELEV